MIFIVIPVVIFFTIRGYLLDYALNQIQQKVQKQYGAIFFFSEAKFRGLSGVYLGNTGILSPKGDTVFFIKSLHAGARLFPLLGGKIRLSYLEGEGGRLLLVSDGARNNYSWLIPKEKQSEAGLKEESSRPDYPGLLDKLKNSLFESIPDLVKLTDFSAIFKRDSSIAQINIPITLLEENNFSARIKGKDNLGSFEWSGSGLINKDEGSARLLLYPIGGRENRVPFTGSWVKVKAGLDTMEIRLDKSGHREDKFKMQGKLLVKGMWVNHWRLSPSEIQVGSATLNYSLGLTDQSLELDSGSKALINQLTIELKGRFTFAPQKQYHIAAEIPEMQSQDFFSSLPKGLFNNLAGIKTQGKLTYKLYFDLNNAHPERVVFNSSLQGKNFRIVEFGNENPTRLQGEFEHDVFEKGALVKQFLVGPSNPDFIPLSEIPPILINSVLSSEDGNFYTHRGFNEEAFRRSIAENYRKGKFARGGSTISMQLVKNVFLTRNKTIARKLEEALLVWLIEENRLLSKDRMLEVYLNIIEWGPGIYGIGPASRFYFKKKPSELNLEECIFLAMIIPRPKGFSYHFDPEGKLKEYTNGYFSLLGGLLCNKGITDSTQKSPNATNLQIRGEAKSFLFKNDSLVSPDTSFTEGNLLSGLER